MKNSSDAFYVGIDSGGTKCDILITDPGRKILFNKFYDGIHYSLSGPEFYSRSISKFIEDGLKRSNLDIQNCKCICIGIAGAREEKDREGLRKAFVTIFKHVDFLITTDAMTALYGAFEGKEGIILISGTGSVLYGYSKNKITRVGGWGRIIGDEGSGYWIGKRALNLTAKEFDRKKKSPSLLAKKLKQRFGIDRSNINQKSFDTRFEIQSLAPLVIECASQKCLVALKIVNEAVEGLTELIITFLKVSKRKKPISISFIGSIIENKNILSDKLKGEIKKLKIVNVVRKKHSSAFGAILLAIENSDITKKL